MDARTELLLKGSLGQPLDDEDKATLVDLGNAFQAVCRISPVWFLWTALLSEVRYKNRLLEHRTGHPLAVGVSRPTLGRDDVMALIKGKLDDTLSRALDEYSRAAEHAAEREKRGLVEAEVGTDPDDKADGLFAPTVLMHLYSLRSMAQRVTHLDGAWGADRDLDLGTAISHLTFLAMPWNQKRDRAHLKRVGEALALPSKHGPLRSHGERVRIKLELAAFRGAIRALRSADKAIPPGRRKPGAFVAVLKRAGVPLEFLPRFCAELAELRTPTDGPRRRLSVRARSALFVQDLVTDRAVAAAPRNASPDHALPGALRRVEALERDERVLKQQRKATTTRRH